MKKFRKGIAALLSVAMLLVAWMPGAFAEEQAAATRGEVVQMLLEAADDYNPGVVKTDIIKGYEDGQLHEERSVTRAEALIMLKRAFGDLPTPTGHNARVALTAENFTDIPAWAETELQDVFDSGIVAGTGEGVFSPDMLVTREQMDLFIDRTFALYGTNAKDDFYAAINKDTLNGLEIKPGRPATNVFDDLTDKASAQVFEIIADIVAEEWEMGSREYKISAMYHSILDQEGRDQAGIAPVQKYLDLIDDAGNLEELTKVQNILSEELLVSPYFKFYLDADLKDSTKYMLSFDTASATFEDVIYQDDADKKELVLTYWKKLFMLGGESEEAAEEMATLCYETEKYISAHTMDMSGQIDYNTLYNIFTMDEIKAMFPGVDMDSVFAVSGLELMDRILIADVDKVKAFATYYKEENLPALKAYAKFAVLSTWGETLQHAFTDAKNDFNQAYYGMTGAPSDEEIALDSIQTVMAGYLEELYVENYFTEETKNDVENMVEDIILVYRKRLENNEWLSDATKEKAIEKLEKMRVKIGYPDKWENELLNSAEILAPEDGGTYFSNLLAIVKCAHVEKCKQQEQSTDKSQWLMSVYEVNAYYNPIFNDITFPAAILQAPFYDVNASYEQNLGGIGFVIAHEITHAFDNSGSQFDADGNVNNWWTEEDYAVFYEKCEAMVAFYDGREAVPGIQMNGLLTLGENIADIGAVLCITEIVSGLENPDFKALYENIARCWASTATREYYEDNAQTDDHSADKVRVNGSVVNCEEFYEAFGITEKDGMYVAPENRVKIW